MDERERQELGFNLGYALGVLIPKIAGRELNTDIEDETSIPHWAESLGLKQSNVEGEAFLRGISQGIQKSGEEQLRVVNDT